MERRIIIKKQPKAKRQSTTTESGKTLKKKRGRKKKQKKLVKKTEQPKESRVIKATVEVVPVVVISQDRVVACRVCHKKLKREPYRGMGIGKICAAKEGIIIEPLPRKERKRKNKRVKVVRGIGKNRTSENQIEIPFYENIPNEN